VSPPPSAGRDYGALQAAFADPSSVAGVATLTADISQGAATGLTLSAGNALTVARDEQTRQHHRFR
jgi:hypothetical protein